MLWSSILMDPSDRHDLKAGMLTRRLPGPADNWMGHGVMCLSISKLLRSATPSSYVKMEKGTFVGHRKIAVGLLRWSSLDSRGIGTQKRAASSAIRREKWRVELTFRHSHFTIH
ncbi:hypothetical protein NL676_002479 [Syzygium grande]|nr:hypothetical protein NL676_002479 [Syzygium grande]